MKKEVFGSSEGCRSGKQPNSCLCDWSPSTVMFKLINLVINRESTFNNGESQLINEEVLVNNEESMLINWEMLVNNKEMLVINGENHLINEEVLVNNEESRFIIE